MKPRIPVLTPSKDGEWVTTASGCAWSSTDRGHRRWMEEHRLATSRKASLDAARTPLGFFGRCTEKKKLTAGTMVGGERGQDCRGGG
uniref:Uncharacterized protein n=1 Tax=Cucumis melo TaxID=3656 RepID=A0A9I9DIX8_CUCME